MHEYWKKLTHNEIINDYCISTNGRIKRNECEPKYATYHSTNGYDFYPFEVVNDTNGLSIFSKIKLFPVDDLVAQTFIPIPAELIGKPIKVEHIDGNLRNNYYENLRWVEDIEEWRIVTYPNIKPNTYEVSNHGRIRKISTKKYYTLIIDIHGYIRVNLSRTDGKRGASLLHRIVAFAFNEKLSNLDIVNHIDSNKQNPYFKNLEWGNYSSNELHAYLVKNKYVKREYEDNDIRLTCELLVKFDGNCKKVFEELQKQKVYIKLYTIQQIKYKKIWNSISDEYFENFEIRGRVTTLNELDVKKIICVLNDTDSVIRTFEILKDEIPNLSMSQISGIKNKRTYSDILSKEPTKFTVKHPTSEKIIRVICEELITENFSTKKVFEKLKNEYPYINEHLIQNIKGKHAWKSISDEYF